MAEAADVVIVGGGPAGAALAIHLATGGVHTVLLERYVEPKWRACGVFSSPLTQRRLLELGLTPGRVRDLSRPISALNLQTLDGAACRLEYEHGHAFGFDRPRLDAVLLDRAREAGADVLAGNVAQAVELSPGNGAGAAVTVSSTHPEARADKRVIKARVVVGADGSRSLVSRAAGIATSAPLLWKSAITFHRADPAAASEGRPMEGRFVFGRGWYVGIAPVPRARVNVGMVVPRRWLAQRTEAISDRLLRCFPAPRQSWMAAPMTDTYAATGALAHRVPRRSGRGWLLVGDAAGFIDPLTGEGLHRAFVSAELAADSIGRWLRGDTAALDDYDRRLRARFRNKDVVSWILQAFLAQPRLLDYALRRLDRRERLRATFTVAMTDQVPASRILDPRYLLNLLRP